MNNVSPLIQAYSQGVSLLRDAVRSVPDDRQDERPVAGKWSVREVVCHVADTEIVYADRMKRVLAEENPTFFEADPDRFTAAMGGPQRSLTVELDLVAAVRAHMLPILTACGGSDFQRCGVHSLDGSMTLQTLLERITNHIPHHVAFIEAKVRAMGSAS